MLFLNEYEVNDAAYRYEHHDVLGPATKFLQAFVNEVNAHSDGWAYWPLPCRAARALLAGRV